MTTSPRLPIELHADILKDLHQYWDRSTLVSAALVNKEWRKQSQRILFSRMSDQLYRVQQDRLVLTHMGFLRSITEHPQRLGPLVRSYVQHHLAFNPAALRNPESLPESGSNLWELMARALPAMVNLKHLKLYPSADSCPARDNYVSSSALLRSFTFQLDTLMWGFIYHPDNGLLEFLRTQKSILNLEGGPSSATKSLTWLDEGVCPHVISASGNLISLAHVARSRKVIAWKWSRSINETKLATQDSLALSRLKYLSLDNYRDFREVSGSIDLNINLLEITGGIWGIGDPPSFSNMPNLRVIVILQNAPSDDEISHIVISSFKQLPSLQYIIKRSRGEYGQGYRYLKLTLSPGAIAGMKQEDLRLDYDNEAPWWAVYNV